MRHLRWKWRWHFAANLRRGVHSIAISSGAHAALLTAMAMIVVNVEQAKTPVEAVTLNASAGGADAELDAGAIGLSSAVEISSFSAPAEGLDASLVSSEHTSSESLSTSLEDEPELLRLTPSSATQRASKPAKARGRRGKPTGKALGTSELQKTGDGSAAGGSSPGGNGVNGTGASGTGNSFFGVQAYGQRIVFVVDISGSMDGSRFRRARTELRRALKALEESQQFFVIFFSTGALPMPSPDLLPATKDNVAQALAWIDGIECGGGTQPLTSLLMAMHLNPDAIYLLTDGKFDPGVVWAVQEAERMRKIPIYSIGFANRKAERLLEAISHESGGIYRFVK